MASRKINTPLFLLQLPESVRYFLLMIIRALVLMFCAATVFGEGGPDSALESRALYQSGKYSEALSALDRSLAPRNAAYYYNKGVIYHALNQEGPALAHLEKAHALKPGDSEISAALEVARSAWVKTNGVSRLDAASTPIQQIGEIISVNLFVISASLLSLIGIALLSTRFLRSKSQGKDFPASLVLFTATALVFTGIFLSLEFTLNRHPSAVVIQTTPLRSGPAATYLELDHLEPGMKVRIEDLHPREGWYKVAYGKSGERGWVPSAILLLLNGG